MEYSWAFTTAIVAFGLTAILGIWLVPFLRKLKYGQTILDIGPKWHQSKQGTPTMGGLMFLIGIPFAVACGWFLARQAGVVGQTLQSQIMAYKLLFGLIMALSFGFIGFIDDYIKVVRRRNLGLTATQKLVLQTLVSSVYLAGLYIAGDTSTRISIPLLGQWELGFFYYPFAVFVMVAVVNAVNLTDGLDGLCASVTFVVGCSFMLITMLLRLWEISLLATALAAACVGFLVWNFYPAKVFMGDTGSLFLGGMVCALGFGVGLPVFLVPIGIVYVIESASVVIQVLYFKATGGKRLFKMSPIHHHFEMCGVTEVRIVLAFSAITALGGAFALFAVTRL